MSSVLQGGFLTTGPLGKFILSLKGFFWAEPPAPATPVSCPLIISPEFNSKNNTKELLLLSWILWMDNWHEQSLPNIYKVNSTSEKPHWFLSLCQEFLLCGPRISAIGSEGLKKAIQEFQTQNRLIFMSSTEIMDNTVLKTVQLLLMLVIVFLYKPKKKMKASICIRVQQL